MQKRIKEKMTTLVLIIMLIHPKVFTQCRCNFIDTLAKYDAGNNKELEAQLQKSVDLILDRNHCDIRIKVRLTDQVANMAAVCEQNGDKYIYVNPKYYRCARDSLSEFEMLGPLCHEIGHHVLGHPDDKTGSLPYKELDADYYCGYYMHEIGAKKYEALRAIRFLGSDHDRRTHPNKIVRMNSIIAGYNRAKYD